MVLQPVFKINGTDYTQYVAFDGLKPSTNDLDADGSGRNILDGLMYRTKIATKRKWTISFVRLDEATMAAIHSAMDSEYVNITTLDPETNRHVTRECYCSSINSGTQRYIGGETVYDGATFNIIER